MTTSIDTDAIDEWRQLLGEGRCLCSSANTDWSALDDLLGNLAAVTAERDEAVANAKWFRDQADHHIGRANRLEQQVPTLRAKLADVWDEGKWAAYSAERECGDGSVVINPYRAQLAPAADVGVSS